MFSNCAKCNGKLTTGDYDGFCTACRNRVNSAMSNRQCETCGKLTPAKCFDCMVDLNGCGEIVMQNWTPRQDDQAELAESAGNNAQTIARRINAPIKPRYGDARDETLSKFKPCPLCGSPKLSIELRGVWKNNDVFCDDCGCQIRCYNNPKELLESWNRRAFPDLSKDFVILNAYLRSLPPAEEHKAYEAIDAVNRIEKTIKGE